MEKTLYDLIREYDSLFPVKGGGILQSLDELEQLVTELGDRKFNHMAEIGSYCGATIWLYSQLFGAEGCTFDIIDIKINPILFNVLDEIKQRKKITFNIQECDSLQAKLDKVDFLHIDGDHRYFMVKSDYNTHYNDVVEGGVIVLHDTLLDEGPGDNKAGTIRFRKELESQGANIKTFGGIIPLCDCFGPNKSNPDNRSIGISIVYK